MPENKTVEIFRTKEEAIKRLLKKEGHYVTEGVKSQSINGSQNHLGIVHKVPRQNKPLRNTKKHFLKTKSSHQNSFNQVFAYELNKILTSHLDKAPEQPDHRLIVDETNVSIVAVASKAYYQGVTMGERYTSKNKVEVNYDQFRKEASNALYEDMIGYGIASTLLLNSDFHGSNILINSENKLAPIDMCCAFSHKETEFEHLSQFIRNPANWSQRTIAKWKKAKEDEFKDMSDKEVEAKTKKYKDSYVEAFIDFFENYVRIREALVIHADSILNAVKPYIDESTLQSQYSSIVETMDSRLLFLWDYQEYSSRFHTDLNHLDPDEKAFMLTKLSPKSLMTAEQQAKIEAVLFEIAKDPMTEERIQGILAKRNEFELEVPVVKMEEELLKDNLQTAIDPKAEALKQNITLARNSAIGFGGLALITALLIPVFSAPIICGTIAAVFALGAIASLGIWQYKIRQANNEMQNLNH